jgi:hypothetical protein
MNGAGIAMGIAKTQKSEEEPKIVLRNAHFGNELRSILKTSRHN